MSSKLPESSSDEMLMLLAEARAIIRDWVNLERTEGAERAMATFGPMLVAINRAIHHQRRIENARA